MEWAEQQGRVERYVEMIVQRWNGLTRCMRSLRVAFQSNRQSGSDTSLPSVSSVCRCTGVQLTRDVCLWHWVV